MMATWRTAAVAVALAGVVLVAAPKLKSSWRNPDPAASPVSKVVVIGFTSEVATRRAMEDALTAEIRKNGGAAEPSYSLIPGPLPKEPAAMKEKVSAAGFDGAVVVRLAGVTSEQYWDPGYVAVVPSYYYSPWSYWGHYYPYAWDMGYMRTQTVVQLEATAYALKGEVLIWSGISESTNPGSVRKLIQEVAVPVGVELKKRNVIR
jgi:hypothetical protein